MESILRSSVNKNIFSKKATGIVVLSSLAWISKNETYTLLGKWDKKTASLNKIFFLINLCVRSRDRYESQIRKGQQLNDTLTSAVPKKLKRRHHGRKCSLANGKFTHADKNAHVLGHSWMPFHFPILRFLSSYLKGNCFVY